MYKLLLHDDAEADLEDIYVRDPDSAYLLGIWLEEMQGDQWVLDRLNQRGFSVRDSGDWVHNIDVKAWVAQWNAGLNLWRVKSWESEFQPFRVVYAFFPRRKTYVVLGIFHKRDFNYEHDNSRTHRVLRAYAELDD